MGFCFLGEELNQPFLFIFDLNKKTMCLSIPAKIESIDGEMAICSIGEVSCNASLQMLDINDIQPGDYVLLHTGFALQKISKEEAEATLTLFDEFEAFNEMLDTEEQEKNQRIV
jgi:hydrogenase expression/formation protein HypC